MDMPVFEEINEVKFNMDHIYDQTDPRAYFHALKNVDYTIPGEAKPIFEKLINLLQSNRDDRICMLDIGCSYGINAALLKYDLSIDVLYAHWRQKSLKGATTEEVVENDKDFFSNLVEATDVDVIGLDIAENALTYAEEAGLINESVSLNLENEILSDEARKDLAPVDLVTSTGCVGYVTEKSFERLLPAVSQDMKPWFANFVLRMFPFEQIEQTLDEAGYVTEKLEGYPFVQRAFESEQEKDQVISKLLENGIDPNGLETEGNLLAEFYLSRPIEDVSKISFDEIMAS